MSFKVSAKYKKNKIHLNFGKGVVSTGGTITILDKNNKKLESIKLGSKKTSGGIYSLKAYVHDYPYDWIALDNDEIFGTLAKHDNKKQEEKTSEDWAFDLRTFWNVSIGGKFYRLDQSTTYKTSSDEWYNYHSTTPEYTPGYDKSGRKDVVLTPLGGIKKLVVKPSKKTKKFSDSLKIDISNAGLMPASGDLSDYLDFEQPIDLSTESKNNTGAEKPTKSWPRHIFDDITRLLDYIKSGDEKGWKKNNVDVITGAYSLQGLCEEDSDGHCVTKSRPGMHLEFDVLSIDISRAARFRGNIFRLVTEYADGKKGPFGQGVKAGKKNYKYYDNNGNVYVNLKVSSKKYFKGGKMQGDFTLTLSERKIFFEDDDGKNTITATYVNDLV